MDKLGRLEGRLEVVEQQVRREVLFEVGMVKGILERVDRLSGEQATLRDLVERLERRVVDHHAVIDRHRAMFDHQMAINEELREFVAELRLVLRDMAAAEGGLVGRDDGA